MDQQAAEVKVQSEAIVLDRREVLAALAQLIRFQDQLLVN